VTLSDVGMSEAVDDDSRRSLAIEQMMERFGERKAFWRQIDSHYEEFTRVWNQDPDRMGVFCVRTWQWSISWGCT